MGEVLPFKSERAIREELKQYLYQRFEHYMVEADEGRLTRALALAAFADEYKEEVGDE